MLRIRATQWSALEDARKREFSARLTSYVVQRFRRSPGSEELAREFVTAALQKAGAYEMARTGEILRLIDLMLRYGRDFDTDPSLPFADRILEERMVYERSPRIGRLEEIAK